MQEGTLDEHEALYDHIELTFGEISIDSAYKKVLSNSAGAVSVFVGTTRDHFEGKKVAKLEYEAYEPMAIKELRQICKDVRKKLEVTKICIVHRLGVVPVGESSVMIAVSSVHRKESLEAVQIIINTLKENVPIWKKEIYENGMGEWKENKECKWARK